jgi:hypothetical protein
MAASSRTARSLCGTATAGGAGGAVAGAVIG